MDDRYQLTLSFVRRHGGISETMRLIAGDASNRKYYRVMRDGKCVVVMDAPPEKGEDVRPFIKIAQFLKAAGLSPPDILASDETHGFLLLQDLGDDLYARLLCNGQSQETPLYKAATDVLVHLHNHATPDLPAYDSSVTPDLAALSIDWYRPAFINGDNTGLKCQFVDCFQRMLKPLDAACTVLIQRDYHAENLLWLPDRSGVKRVGLLDFQDAMLGHPSYDLVSILQDARRDVSPETQHVMQRRFINQKGIDGVDFTYAYHLMGLQRNLRILGVFARLCIRDSKPGYIDFIPRVWGHIETCLSALEDSNLTKMLMDALPAPTPESLTKLKEISA